MHDDALAFLSNLHPYSAFPAAVLDKVAKQVEWRDVGKNEAVYALGDQLACLYIIASGKIAVTDANGVQVSMLERGNSFGERGLLRDGLAATSAKAVEDARLLCLPAALFDSLRAEQEPFRQFFDRNRTGARASADRKFDLTNVRVETLMIPDPVTCTPDTTLIKAAQAIRDHRISCLCVTEGDTLVGILTVRDLTGKRGADVVVDSVGEATWMQSLKAAAKGGRIVTCGATSGPNPAEEIRLIFWNQLSIIGSTMGSREDWRQLVSAVNTHGMRPVVDTEMLLAEGRTAYERLERADQFGKIVLTIDG